MNTRICSQQHQSCFIFVHNFKTRTAELSSVYKCVLDIMYNVLSLDSTEMLTRDIDIGTMSVRLSATLRYCIETA